MNDYKDLAKFLNENEDQITGRFFQYVKDVKFSDNTILLEGTWKMAIESIVRLIVEAIEKEELGSIMEPNVDRPNDPIREFGIRSAKMHRSYGITLPMFFTLFSRSHCSFNECITEHFDPPNSDAYKTFMDRVFDTILIGFVSEWDSEKKDDITLGLMERNRTLTNEKNGLLTIFENLPEGVVILDIDGSPAFVNQTYAKLFLQNKVAGETYYDPARNLNLPTWLTAHVTDMLSMGERERVFEMDQVTSVGPKKFDIQITSIEDANDVFQGFIVLYNDITERQHMFNELRLADEKIRLLGDITRHDILNILTVLNGNIQLLEMKAKDPNLAKYLKAIGDSSNDIQKLLESAKNYQKLGSQDPTWIRLRDTVSIGISSAGLDNVNIHNEVDERVEIFSDPMLDRAFGNLASNIIKHAPEAKNIWIKVERSTKDSIDVIFEDDGPGVPMELKEAIFSDKFKGRAKHGLHYVQRLLQLTGISIRENGEPGKGARFVIHVPKRNHHLAELTPSGEK